MERPQPTELEKALFDELLGVHEYFMDFQVGRVDDSDLARIAVLDAYRDKYANICLQCGCTEEAACAGGCAWVNAEHTLCDNPVCVAQAEKAREIAEQARKVAA